MSRLFADCRKPYYWLSDSDLKRLGKQSFCSVCERWQFKKDRCKLFKEGKQK